MKNKKLKENTNRQMHIDEEKKSSENIAEDNGEDKYFLYTEKIVVSPKVKYKKLINGLKGLGYVFAVFAAATFISVFIVPWVESKLPKKQDNKAAFTIEKDEYNLDIDQESLQLQPEKDDNNPEETDYEMTMSKLRSRVSAIQKSIVAIDTFTTDINNIAQEESSETETCGLIIGYVNSQYIILTNYDRINSSENIIVKFSDSVQVRASIIDNNASSGITIISVSSMDVPFSTTQNIAVATLDNSYNVHQGDLVITAGKLYGQTRAVDYGTITEISSRAIIDNTYEIFNTSLAYNEGDYGFTFNTQGNLIGITTKPVTGKNLKIIGISDLKSIIESMTNKGGFVYFGIIGQNVTGSIADSYGLPMGVYISEVEIDSPAFNAGLQAGDVIYAINGNTVLTIQDFSETLYQYDDGQVIYIMAKRQGKEEYHNVFFSATVRIQ